MLSELSSQRKINTMISRTWNQKNKIKKQTKQTYRHRTDPWLPEGRQARGLGERGEGIRKYRSVVTE